MSDSIGIIDATSPDTRIDALCRFLEFWTGPRLPQFGEPTVELDKFALPRPLRRLYEFAGRWPHFRFGDSEDFLVPYIGNDRLRKVQYVETGNDGKMKFLAESQGCWDGMTLPEGDDPPVWIRTFQQRSRNDTWIPRDKLVSRSLSSFLTTLVLRELVFGSRVHGGHKSLEALFRSEHELARPIWLDGTYALESSSSVFLWDQMLVLEEKDADRVSCCFGANSMEGVNFFRKHRGPDSYIMIQDFGRCEEEPGLCLSIHANGSAEAKSNSAVGSVNCEPGTIDFPMTGKLLFQASYFATYQLGEHRGDPSIRFHAEEGYEWSNGCYLTRHVARQISDRVFACAKGLNDFTDSICQPMDPGK